MEAFTLDTSGVVRARYPGTTHETVHPDGPAHTWDGLSSFMQGYIEAAFAELNLRDRLTWAIRASSPSDLEPRAWRFDMLAGEALERIMKDCARFREYGEREQFECVGDTVEHGRLFWAKRNTRPWPSHAPIYALDGFPPQTLALDDTGRVVFGEGA